MQLGLDEKGEVVVSSIICHAADKINSNGVWFGEDPLSFSVPLLLLQLSLISIFTRAFTFLLRPFGQPSIVSQILGGVILGPSVMGRNSKFAAKVFPARGRGVFDTLSVFGFMLFVFSLGVKMDLSMVPRLGKRGVAIGFLAFSVPYIVSGSVAFVLDRSLSLDRGARAALPFVVGIQSLTAFPTIACFLGELRILNSEMGRLASSSSVVCDVFYWSIVAVKLVGHLAARKSVAVSIGYLSSVGALFASMVYLVRPAVQWAIRRTPEGEAARDVHVFGVIAVVMVFGFLGEVVGLNAFVPSFVLGLMIPDGPPLGSALVEKLDCFVSVMLMPIFFTMCGLRMDVFAIQDVKSLVAIELVVFVAFFAKVVASAVPPIFFRMPIMDALSLGLIMNAKGVVEIFLLLAWKSENILNEECFSIMVISMLVIAGIVSPLVRAMYDPSKRFLAYRRRTILHHRPGEELRILACIHRQDNVPAIIDLMLVSNADSPISLVVLHLVKLVGRASSLLLPYATPPRDRRHESSAAADSGHRRQRHQRYPSQSERIFNAFARFGGRAEGVQCFKGVSPYATMHNDVCSLALDKRSTLIVVPHHKLWIGGTAVETSHHLRHLNASVLDKAPCSVAVLVDRGGSRRNKALLSLRSPYRVAALFFGGADDREALAYAGRMAKHPDVLTTLFCFSSAAAAGELAEDEGDEEECVGHVSARSMSLDTEVLSKFRLSAFRDQRVSFEEAEVEDGEAVMSVLRRLDGAFELVVVGRRHGDKSWLTSALGKWKDIGGELGTVGEILASPEVRFGAAVLVVQQQTRVWGMRDPEESTRLKGESIRPDI